MKIESTFVIELDGATFVFKKPTMKELLQAKDMNFTDFVFGKLVEVQGLSNGNADLCVEEVKTLDLPVDAVMKIVNEWNAKVATFLSSNKEAAEKNGQPPTLNG